VRSCSSKLPPKATSTLSRGHLKLVFSGLAFSKTMAEPKAPSRLDQINETLSFSKVSVFAVHPRTGNVRQRFQMYPLGRAFSKSSVLGKTAVCGREGKTERWVCVCKCTGHSLNCCFIQNTTAPRSRQQQQLAFWKDLKSLVCVRPERESRGSAQTLTVSSFHLVVAASSRTVSVWLYTNKLKT